MHGTSSTVSLSEGMTTSDQGNCFLVVHSHAAKSLTNVTGRGFGIRHSIGSFGVDINQTHLHSREWIFELTLTRVTIICQPRILDSPINIIFGFPNIGASTAESKCLETHRVKGDITDQNKKISPGNLVPIFLFHRPK